MQPNSGDGFVLELRGIDKNFPGVKALQDVHFQLRPGEIHALMGENGAGKSTFIKIITGVHQPDAGEIRLDGKPVRFANPKDSQARGIAAIYQHVTCYPDLSVTENIFIGHETVAPLTRAIQWTAMHEEARRLLAELGSDIDPRSEMGTLSVAQQQIVEIAKALSTRARIVIMDEPTAALTKRESEELYRITLKLRDSGVSVIFISHRFEDMYRLASRVTVFRDSQYIGSWDVDKIGNDDLIMAMVGREITQLFPEKRSEIGAELLRVENLGRAGLFAGVSFTLHQGEILGLTGLVGAGRSEVCQAIFGILPADKGTIHLRGKPVTIRCPGDAIGLGIGYLPEDRQKQGLVLPWGIGRNISLPVIDQFAGRWWLNEKKEGGLAHALAELVRVKARGIDTEAGTLSGGNQQKVIVAKLLAAKPTIVIIDEPTKGVDVGAKAAIHEIMGELASQGIGIIMVSSEMPEVLGMSDRIAVMREGRISALLEREEATQEKILEAAMAARYQAEEAQHG
ncbi:MAG: sugar ABC transporter ATP-binding protein [Propionivibrio sp.]